MTYTITVNGRALFAPGDKARFILAPEIEVLVDQTIINGVEFGVNVYSVTWYADGKRNSQNVGERELEAIPAMVGAVGFNGGDMKPYYEHAGITLFHADCRDILPHVKADCVVTDPPYGIAYRHGSRGGNRSNGMDGHSIVGDDTPFDPAPLLALALPSILWGANNYADKLPSSRGWLVWDKRADGPQMDQSDAELAWCSFGSVARKFTRRWSGACLGGEEQRTGRVHVNQKPVDLLRWCLGFVPDGVILDPFAGSGTTLVAAKLEGRKAIGIEIEERYCEIAATRLAQEVFDWSAKP